MLRHPELLDLGMSLMLETDGYMYLRIEDPLCAWNTYRGVLVSANVITTHPGCVSVWIAETIRRGVGSSRMNREARLEMIRRQRHSDKVSRFCGFYTFANKDAALQARAAMGQPHMTAENLVEINLNEARKTSIHDSNWITYHGDDDNLAWIDAYWRGEQCPSHEPLWEVLVEGRINILGTQLRDKAYELVRANFPDSLCLLEIARIAAWVGSDLGSVAAFLESNADGLAMQYYLNMVDANDVEYLKKFRCHISSGEPVNHNDIRPFVDRETLGSVPDLRPLSFSISKDEVAYLAQLI